MINEFGGTQLRCADDELVPPAQIANSEYQGSRVRFLFSLCIILYGIINHSLQICLMTEGEQILRDKGYQTDFSYRWVDLAILFAFTFGFLLVSFLAIRFSHQASTGGASGAVVVKKKKNKNKVKKAPQERKSKYMSYYYLKLQLFIQIFLYRWQGNRRMCTDIY